MSHITRPRAIVLFLGVSLALTGCVVEEEFEVGSNQGDITWEEFLDTVYQEPDTGVFIVNGDEAIADLDGLREFYDLMASRGALVVHRSGGQDAKWSNAQKVNLTYCVSNNFGSYKSSVVSAMNGAGNAWENSANVDFKYSSGQDSSCTNGNNNVVFNVRMVSGQPYLARAFFPNYARSSREVLIDSSSFGNISPYTLKGILRHELGHALGFRHEHTRPEAGTCYEDSSWRALTTYDARSVMHYPQCNGTNTGDLKLTTKDRNGAAALYGAP